jgi:hypothetical protein
MSVTEGSASIEIDEIIANVGGWRAATLTTLRRIVLSANADVVEEIKWRKPSKPEGVATWVCDGNVCMADLLKSAVRLTFPKGARLDDPAVLFNSRLNSSAVRAIDFVEDSRIHDGALRQLVDQAITMNRHG